MKNKGGKYAINKLERRIIDISYQKKLSHIGSCLTAVRQIDAIYQIKKNNDIFVLSNGHAGLALYVVLEKYKFGNAEELFDMHGVHPNRDVVHDIHASSGSLGHGLGIAVGLALSYPDRNIYVMVSDGEMAEGSCWESLRIAGELKLENLKVAVNANGYGAYGKVDGDLLDMRMQYFYPSLVNKTATYDFPDFLQGLQAHYHTLTKEEYEEIVC